MTKNKVNALTKKEYLNIDKQLERVLKKINIGDRLVVTSKGQLKVMTQKEVDKAR